MRLSNVVASELDKLRTLPGVVLTAVGTAATGVAIAAALVASSAGRGVSLSSTDVTIEAVPFVQAGLILLGVFPACHEHTGSQLRTTLAAVPHRGLLLAGKTVATLVVVALTVAASVGGLLAAAVITQHLVDAPVDDGGTRTWLVLGAATYLVLVGMLSHAVALLVRHLVPALVGTLSLILIVSPVLAGLSEHARWLPDRAARQLYDPADAVLTATTGALVMLAWIVLAGAVATVQFVRRDA